MDQDTLLARIEALEREVRELRAAEGHAAVTAPFQVVDERGRVLMELRSIPGGGALTLYATELCLQTAAGNVTARMLGTEKTGGALALFDEMGEPVVILRADEGGTGSVSLHDRSGQNVATLPARATEERRFLAHSAGRNPIEPLMAHPRE